MSLGRVGLGGAGEGSGGGRGSWLLLHDIHNQMITHNDTIRLHVSHVYVYVCEEASNDYVSGL